MQHATTVVALLQRLVASACAHHLKDGQGARVDKLEVIGQRQRGERLALDGVQTDHLRLHLALRGIRGDDWDSAVGLCNMARGA